MIISAATALGVTGSSRGQDITAIVPPQHDVAAGAPGFDSANRGYFRAGTAIFVRDGNDERRIDFASAAKLAIDRDLFNEDEQWDGNWDTSFRVDTSIVFDDDDVAYALITPRRSNLRNAALLYSLDYAKSWHAIRLRGITATIELRDGFNDLFGPPTVLSHQNYSTFRGGKLWLEAFRRDGAKVRRRFPPQLITENSILAQKHSGAGNSTFTRHGRIFVAYPSSTPPASGKGTQSFIRMFDLRKSAFSGDEVLLGVSATTTGAGPDYHDFPVITADRAGVLMVVLGAHHAPLQYTVSKVPLDISGGWTRPRHIGGEQSVSSFTYPSLNTLPDETINIFARQEDPQYRFNLVQFRKPPGQPFQTWSNGETHRVIAAPPRRYYVVWRHRVTLDRRRGLYVNYRYEPNQLSPGEARVMRILETTRHNCRKERCFYGVTAKAMSTIVSRDSGLTFREY